MSPQPSHNAAASLPDAVAQSRLDTPLYRALRTLGLFDPLRRVSRRLYRKRMQKGALAGHGLVPEESLKATYAGAVMLLRDRCGPQIGDYLEFGVCHGSSMSCMHDVLKATGTTGTRLFGFDSFEGLPPEADSQDGGFFSKGQFDSDINFTRNLLTRRGIDWTTTHLIQGWFAKTCVPETAERYGISKVGIVMIDCDIYSAAKEALDFVGPLLAKTSVVVFDDWNSGDLASQNLGEKKAFGEFLAENRHIHPHQLPPFYENSAVFMLIRTDLFESWTGSGPIGKIPPDDKIQP